MRRLSVFNQISLDGYFVDRGGDMSWAKEGNDEEFNAFTSDNAGRGGALVFGRITYQMMASFWPTKMAAQMMPVVAERMNSLPKLVFSRTITQSSWSNTTVLNGDLVHELRRLKGESGPNMVIMGSGQLVAQLASAPGLIDEYQVIVNPVVLGAGRTIWEGLASPKWLSLSTSRVFRNGKVYLRYEPRGAVE